MAGQPGRSGGRNRKPTEVKRLLGNPGRRPLPAPLIALPAVVSAEQAPRPQSGDEMVQAMLDNGASAWIGPTDVAKVDRARSLWDDVALAARRWRESGDPADARVYEALDKRLDACLSSLGLDPIQRSRLGVAEVKARSKLEELRLRRESRAGRPAG